MADALYGTQLTDEMIANPWMFDPTQKSNQFSLFNNQALPWPPSYNTGAGGPVNAATGQPIQSFQAWQQANPGGTTLNNTAAQPQQAQQPQLKPGGIFGNAPQGGYGLAMGQPIAMSQLAQKMGVPDQGSTNANDAAALMMMMGVTPTADMGFKGQQQPQQAAPQQSGPPNNWMAAINALSNPGTPAIGGATVPMAQGYQPAGGVNQAFLQQAAGRPNMNQNFMSALGAIQGRPQR